MASGTLFYPRDTVSGLLHQLVARVRDPEPAFDVLQFDAEAGGSSDRDLAVPFLPDMDEVVVSKAELRFGARRIEQEIAGYRVVASSGTDAGLVVALDRPARIAKIVIDTPAIAAGALPPGAVKHLVVRSAEPDAKAAGGFAFGPPLFADPPFELPSKLYGPVLGGLEVRAVDGGATLVRLPDTLGSGWLIQCAHGAEATQLVPVAFSSAVRSVSIAAAVRGLTLTALGETPARNTVLWSSANALDADGATQVAAFTPVAQKQLASALVAADPAAAGATLPIALRFEAQSAGQVAIEAKTLEVTYRVHPLGRDPVTLGLAGDWGTLALRAPAGRRPRSGTLRLVARHLGRALNDGSAPPPATSPSAGVLVDAGHCVAAAAPFAPLAGQAAGSPLELVAVSVPLEAAGVAEVVLEVRADAAGAPGAALGQPVVRQCRPGDVTSVAFELAEPLSLATGGAPVWISLRTTRGEVRWFAAGAGTARVSADGGQTWGEVDPRLVPRAAPLVQLFHASAAPVPAPELELRIGAHAVARIVLAGPAAADPREFASASTVVESALLDALGRTRGTGRAATDVRVFSRAVAELTIAELTLDYDPQGAP